MADKKYIITSGEVAYGDQQKWAARKDGKIDPGELSDMLHGQYSNRIPYLHTDDLTTARDYLQASGASADMARARRMAGIYMRESGEPMDVDLVKNDGSLLKPNELLDQINAALANRTARTTPLR